MSDDTIDTCGQSRRAVTPPSQYGRVWLDRIRYLPRVSPVTDLGLTPGDHVLMTTAHPDDETFAAGATLAALSQLGVFVHVLCMTAGEAALNHVDHHPPDLARRRVAELTSACRALGAEFSLANLPDGLLASRTEEIQQIVGRAVTRIAPRQVFTLWWGDPHPDHAAVGTATRTVAEDASIAVTGFPIWAQHWSDPRSSMLEEKFFVMANPELAQLQRTEAVAAYASQLEPLHGDLDAVLPPWFVDWTAELGVIA